MDKSKPLRGVDYMLEPRSVLVNHPSFSPHAYRLIQAISRMTTREIEKLDITIIGGKNRG